MSAGSCVTLTVTVHPQFADTYSPHDHRALKLVRLLSVKYCRTMTVRPVQLVLWIANAGDLGPFDTQTGHQPLLIENEGISIILQA